MFFRKELTVLNKAFYAQLFCALIAGSVSANAAQIVPNTAEIDRIKPGQSQSAPEFKKQDTQLPKTKAYNIAAPEAAREINLLLKGVKIDGATAYSQRELKKTYSKYLDKKVTLEVAWVIAAKITEKYNNDGYFLSRAYVPQQEVKNGVINIKIVEGYIGQIKLKNPKESNYVIQELISSFSTQKPVKSEQLERFLLEINELPGQKFKGVLSSLDSADEAKVKLTLVSLEDKSDKANVTIDNYGSRYIGPTEITASYKTSLLPLNETSISLSSSIPTNEVLYGSFEHSVTVLPYTKLGFSFDKTKAAPGYNLNQFDVNSNSKSIGLNLSYQVIRQRDQNLSLKFAFDNKNTDTTLLGNQISHDQIRALRATLAYDIFDNWNGYNSVNLRLSEGINGLRSSKAGDLNLTRADAKPDFQKIELNLQRQQRLADDFSFVTSTSMQKASGTLYSSEQFGYGGQSYGRAYDSSDILGDNGISAMFELRYTPPDFYEDISFSPYCFYDVGKIWVESPSIGEPTSLSASSAGFGTRLNTDIGLSGNLGLAFPLTRDVSAPIYWNNKTAPRLLLQISQGF